MNKKLLKDTLGWGSLLWLIGYILGIVLFMIVPHNLIGWVLLPIGTVITLWVLFKKIHGEDFGYYVKVGVVWVVVAIVFDYLFLVKMLKPENGYYKLDVYFYYILAFALPAFTGWYKLRPKEKTQT